MPCINASICPAPDMIPSPRRHSFCNHNATIVTAISSLPQDLWVNISRSDPTTRAESAKGTIVTSISVCNIGTLQCEVISYERDHDEQLLDSGFASCDSDDECTGHHCTAETGSQPKSILVTESVKSERALSAASIRRLRWHESVVWNEKVRDFSNMDKETRLAIQRRMRHKHTVRHNSPHCREANRVFQLHHAGLP